MMNMIFEEDINKMIEVYIDDTIVKFREEKLHKFDLSNMFNYVKQYNIRLNLEKCTFGVRVREFWDSILLRHRN